MTTLKKLSLLADEVSARAIVGYLGSGVGTIAILGDAVAITRFEAGAGQWIVEAYYDAAADLMDIAPLLSAALPTGASFVQTAIEAVPDEDWAAKVQRDLKPVTAGRFVVHGSHDRTKIGHRRFAIEIDAGEAFGTAHHGSTAGCLIALDRLGHLSNCVSVADIGCGSGILAIAAAKLWPRARVTAGDIDSVATGVAAANMAINRVGRQVRVVTAPGFEHPALRLPHTHDLVLANILAQPLQALAPAIAHALRRRGVAIVAGLLVSQAPAVIASYQVAGFGLRSRIERAGWTTLTFVKRS